MSLEHLNILPECYVDTNLIQYLMRGNVNHQHCCNKVVGIMEKKFNNRFAIGIIDQDKVKVGYLEGCEEVINTEHLTIWKHKQLPHFLVTVKPAIERFLLDCAKEQKVKPENFGLSHNLKSFIEQTKKITSSTDQNIRNFIIAIKKNAEIHKLGQVLHYLKNTNYSADIHEVERLMV